MKFRSVRSSSPTASFTQAVIAGLADDGGLFVPVQIPRLTEKDVASLRGMEPVAIARVIARTLLEDEIEGASLDAIVAGTLDFSIPLVPVEENTFVLELFHGPTLAFKDIGARFLARVLAHLSRAGRSPLTVLVATSGDTGGAVAQGFYGVDGVQTVVLYPSGKVSSIQESQFSTLGGNVTALEVGGSFDECQTLVKQAMSDPDLARVRTITSANSINVARLLAQTFYYFMAYGTLGKEYAAPVFSVPSGNLGNLTAGVMSRAMGLPVHMFLAASNANDVLPEYLRTGRVRPRPSVQTISNAMDVGDPSNFARLEAHFGGDVEAMRRVVRGSRWSDEATVQTIRAVYERHGYVLDPHTAVAYSAWHEYRKAAGDGHPGVVLATAHPAKFLEAYDRDLRAAISVPERLAERLGKTKASIPMTASFARLKTFLLDTANVR